MAQPTVTSVVAPPLVPVGNNAVTVAQSKIGTAPYVWGGGRDSSKSPLAQLSYDCSSFVSSVYKSLGFNVAAQTDAILQQATVGKTAQIVSTPQPGDMVLFKNPTPSNGLGVTTHVEIYAGNGQTVGAQSPGIGITQRALAGGEKIYVHVVGYNNTSPDALPPVPVPVQGVPGFISGNLDTINKALKAAWDAGIDPHIWLGIIAKESSFNPTAVNPKSGACGLAQIYPCISGLSIEANLAEGAKRFKAFLDGCGGDTNCALNKYSGGGGQSYIQAVTGFAQLIKASNPNLSSGGVTNVPIGDSPTTATNGAGDCASKCPKWDIGVPPLALSIPDLGCIFQCSIQQLADTVNTWWVNWQKEHVANWLFVVGGFVVLVIGVSALIQMQSGSNGISTASIAKMAVAV